MASAQKQHMDNQQILSSLTVNSYKSFLALTAILKQGPNSNFPENTDMREREDCKLQLVIVPKPHFKAPKTDHTTVCYLSVLQCPNILCDKIITTALVILFLHNLQS